MAKNRLINLDELNAEDRKKVEEILAQQTKEKKQKSGRKNCNQNWINLWLGICLRRMNFAPH